MPPNVREIWERRVAFGHAYSRGNSRHDDSNLHAEHIYSIMMSDEQDRNAFLMLAWVSNLINFSSPQISRTLSHLEKALFQT